jgi:hypothetical protein
VKSSDTAATLLVHPDGGAILRAFVNFFGLPADGSTFGTWTVN